MTFKVLKSIFKTLVICTSSKFRSYLESWLRDMYTFAKNTENPFDDYFIEFIADMLECDLDKKKSVEVSTEIHRESRR